MGDIEKNLRPYQSCLKFEQTPSSPIISVWLNELKELSVKEQLDHLRIGEIVFIHLDSSKGLSYYRGGTNDWIVKISRWEVELPLTFGHELGHILVARDEEILCLPPKLTTPLAAWEKRGVRHEVEENLCEEFGKAWSAVERNTMESLQLFRDLSNRNIKKSGIY